MKKTFERLISALAEKTPDIPFAVHFWDGDMQNYGQGEPSMNLPVASYRVSEE